MWVNTKEVAGNGLDDDGNGYADDFYGYNFASKIADPSPETWTGQGSGGQIHGTHVAGLAAANSNNGVGVAGVGGIKARVMALNVFGKIAGADTVNIDEAIKYAADNGADIINMSLGGPGRAETTGDAIKYAVSKGVVVIVAAGNDNKDINTNFFTPASFGSEVQGMLAVGAIDSDTSKRCSFSNYNTTRVEIGAPGCNGLFSTVPNNGYQSLQGTSMASPVTAGAAALAVGLIKTRSGADANPAEVEDIMKAGSRVESSLTSYFKDGKTVDLVTLYTEVDKRYPVGGNSTPTCP
jgi:subtilisin family serine protease